MCPNITGQRQVQCRYPRMLTFMCPNHPAVLHGMRPCKWQSRQASDCSPLCRNFNAWPSSSGPMSSCGHLVVELRRYWRWFSTIRRRLGGTSRRGFGERSSIQLIPALVPARGMMNAKSVSVGMWTVPVLSVKIHSCAEIASRYSIQTTSMQGAPRTCVGKLGMLEWVRSSCLRSSEGTQCVSCAEYIPRRSGRGRSIHCST